MGDPFDEVGEALRTTIGADELNLKMKLGNEGYTEYKRRTDSIADSSVLQSIFAARLVEQQVAYLKGKASFWSSLGLAVVLLAVTGAVLGCFVIARVA